MVILRVRLRMSVGKELKVLAVVDDSRVISVTTVVFLDVCVLVN